MSGVDVVVVPFDSGRWGERMGRGPARLLAEAVEPALRRMAIGYRTQEIALPGLFPAEIRMAFALCAAVSERVRESIAAGRFPLVLSGNCNVAVGTIAGSRPAGVVWFDAHGEATTPETTTSGFLDGMGISILTGRCWRTMAQSIPGFEPVAGERIALLGARDLEPAEEALLGGLGVRRECEGMRDVYTHFDLDVLDPSEAVWNQWAPPGGLSVQAVCDTARRLDVRAAGFASYDPDADRGGGSVRAVSAIVEALLSPRKTG
jgi:arginase